MGKMVRFDDKTYDALVRLAEQNNRTLIGQIREMLKIIVAMNIWAVDYLPHPNDANPVPVITVEK